VRIAGGVWWAAVVTLLTACAGTESGGTGASELPIAAAPTGATVASGGATAAESERWPDWEEPEDPGAAYHVLMDKVAWLRANPTLDVFDEIYAPNSRMEGVRAGIRKMVDRGIRLVDGHTLIEDTTVISEDNDSVFLQVRSREEGWVRVRADGTRKAMPAQCEEYVVELRDGGDGWRIATVMANEESTWRCDS
jgi:hypothetical protein